MPKIIGKDQGALASLAGLKLARLDRFIKLGLPEAGKNASLIDRQPMLLQCPVH